MKKINLLGINLSTGAYKDFVSAIIQSADAQQSHYVCVANVHMLVEAHKDKNFAGIVSNAQIITPDGKPLAWASKILHGIKQQRVAGMDLLPDLLQQAQEKNLPVYFYGGQQNILDKTSEYLKVKYPQLIVAGLYSPPFRKLSLTEEDNIIQRINQSGARLVFVILGCPKQERWMAAMKGRIHAMMVGVGGALPVMVGSQKRAPVWMQKTGFEWLYRLVQEPRRLFKRYAVTNSIFIHLLLRAYLKQIAFRKKLNGSYSSNNSRFTTYRK